MASERRTETSRLEGFSDAVFAFALTLLVVSLQVPSSYDELVHTLRSFVAFAPSFAALIWIWYLSSGSGTSTESSSAATASGTDR